MKQSKLNLWFIALIGEYFVGLSDDLFALGSVLIGNGRKNAFAKANVREREDGYPMEVGDELLLDTYGRRLVECIEGRFLYLSGGTMERECWPFDMLLERGYVNLSAQKRQWEKEQVDEALWLIGDTHVGELSSGAGCECELCDGLDYKFCEGVQHRYCVDCEWEGIAEDCVLECVASGEDGDVYDECCPGCGSAVCIGERKVVAEYDKAFPF